MKKNKTMRAATLLLALILITTCFVGGTLAKYTSSASTESASATVAKWDIEVTGTDVDGTAAAQKISVTGNAPTITFDLFTTVKEADGTTAESDVASGKIAPGTGGSFSLKVDNKSEVTASYTITLTETNTSNLPIEYCVSTTAPGQDATWSADIPTITSTGNLAMNNGTATHTVYWRWADKTENNTTDTAFGINASATLGISASITVSQVD